MKEDYQSRKIEAEVNDVLSGLNNEKRKVLIETALNTTYPGLTLYVRDTNLSEEHIKAYYPGQIILEKSYSECSCFGRGGVPTNCRYTILSNHMFSMDELIDKSDIKEFGSVGCGLSICKRNSHFMVLDIYQYNGKTQIMLLHLPDYELWKLFSVLNIVEEVDGNPGHDADLIQEIRKSFEDRCLLPPDSRISSPEILQRWNFPLGMSDDGILFDINQEVPDYNPENNSEI